MSTISSSGIVLVMDLECACWRGRPPKGMVNEIIEIGITSVDIGKLEIVKKDTILVKPYNAFISKFCTELTGIDQELLDAEGVKFKRAIQLVQERFAPKRKLICTWGDDVTHFNAMCEHWKVKYPFSPRHLDLKVVVSSLLGSKHELGVASALDLLNMKFEGNPHRALDDAFNTARIMLEVWKKFRIHNDSNLKVEKKNL